MSYISSAVTLCKKIYVIKYFVLIKTVTLNGKFRTNKILFTSGGSLAWVRDKIT